MPKAKEVLDPAAAAEVAAPVPGVTDPAPEVVAGPAWQFKNPGAPVDLALPCGSTFRFGSCEWGTDDQDLGSQIAQVAEKFGIQILKQPAA